MFCNPQNPTGRIYERDELIAFAKFCERHDLLICSDEIHCELRLDDRPHIPIASLSDEIAARTITLMAPTKTYNTPGLVLRLRGDSRCGAAPALLGCARAVSFRASACSRTPQRSPRTKIRPTGSNRLRDYLRGNRDALETCVEYPARRFDDARRGHLSRLD